MQGQQGKQEEQDNGSFFYLQPDEISRRESARGEESIQDFKGQLFHRPEMGD